MENLRSEIGFIENPSRGIYDAKVNGKKCILRQLIFMFDGDAIFISCNEEYDDGSSNYSEKAYNLIANLNIENIKRLRNFIDFILKDD